MKFLKTFLFFLIFLLIFSNFISGEETQSNQNSFKMAQLKYRGGNWNSRPNSLKPLLNYLMTRTSVEADLEVDDLNPASKEIFSYPFLIWIGNQEFPQFSFDEIENLRKFLRFGGFIFVEDSQGSPGFGFDSSVRREINRIFPEKSLVKLSNDHTVYRSFYLLENASGRIKNSESLEGIDIQGRTVLIYSQNDVLGALSRDSFGNWEYELVSGNRDERSLSYRLGINIIMYALCDDYKKDALHVEYILKRRRLP